MEFVTAKGVIKALISPLVDLCGIYDVLLNRRVFAQPSWVILMYHRVIDSPAADPFRLGMCVDRAHFAEQIDFLTQLFTPLTVSEVMRRLREGRPLPRNALSVTFDDGYRDFVDNALPVLERYNCPSTLYVSTGGIETGERFWWDRVIAAFAGTRRARLDLELSDRNGRERVLRIGLANRRTALVRTLNALWAEPPARLEGLVAGIEADLGSNPRASSATRLSLEDVARLDAEAVEVAAHCERHADLTGMRTDEVLRDITESRRRLEDAVGHAIDGFAYPGGRQDHAVRQTIARAGFSYAAGTDRGVNRRPFEAFNLRRIGMPDTAIADFKRCLSTAAGVEAPRVSSESVQWP